MNKPLIANAIFLLSVFVAIAQHKITPSVKINLKLKEPSDVCLSASGKSLFMVSDNGELAETDFNGNVLRKLRANLVDAEGVCAVNDKIYVADEFTRSIHVFSVSDWKFMYEVPVAHTGARNRGYEALTYNPVKKEFYLFTESRPLLMLTLDEALRVKNRIELNLKTDISAACFHGVNLWLLSDEAAMVYLFNPAQNEAQARFRLSVINPEGLAWLNDGKLLVVSDDRQQLYVYQETLKE